MDRLLVAQHQRRFSHGQVIRKAEAAEVAELAIDLQPDGKIVAAGESSDGIALARYGNDLILHKTVTPAAVYPGQAITPTTLDYFPPNNRHSAVLVVKLGRIYLPLVLRNY